MDGEDEHTAEVHAIVAALQDENVRPDHRNRDGKTLLHRAVETNSSDLVRAVLDHGASVHKRNRRGQVPLVVACAKGADEAIVRMLMGADSPVDSKDNNDWTSLHHACENGHLVVVQELIAGEADLWALSNWKRVPMHLAAEKGHTDVVALLIDCGGDMWAKDNYRNTPLHVAAREGHADVVRLLCERAEVITTQKKPLLRVKNIVGATPLVMAALSEQDETVKVMLEHGAVAIDAIEKFDGFAALHIAAEHNRSAMVSALLKAGATVNLQSFSGSTPLHLACTHDHVDVARMLLQYGAVIDAHDVNNVTPRGCVPESSPHLVRWRELFDEFADAVTLLPHTDLDSDDDDDDDERDAPHNRPSDVVDMLLDDDERIDTSQHPEDMTRLHIAAGEGHERLVRLLLATGADVDARTEDGWAPLHLACVNGHLACAKILLFKAANVDAQDNWGRTPLHLAAEQRYEEVVGVLIEHGASMELRNDDGHSFIDIVTSEADEPEVVEQQLRDAYANVVLRPEAEKTRHSVDPSGPPLSPRSRVSALEEMESTLEERVMRLRDLTRDLNNEAGKVVELRGRVTELERKLREKDKLISQLMETNASQSRPRPDTLVPPDDHGVPGALRAHDFESPPPSRRSSLTSLDLHPGTVSMSPRKRRALAELDRHLARLDLLQQSLLEKEVARQEAKQEQSEAMALLILKEREVRVLGGRVDGWEGSDEDVDDDELFEAKTELDALNTRVENSKLLLKELKVQRGQLQHHQAECVHSIVRLRNRLYRPDLLSPTANSPVSARSRQRNISF